MIIIKRDGREVNYDRRKIIVAIKSANNEVPPEERVTDRAIHLCTRFPKSILCRTCRGAEAGSRLQLLRMTSLRCPAVSLQDLR